MLDCKDLYEPSEVPAPEIAGYQAKDCGTHYQAEPYYGTGNIGGYVQTTPTAPTTFIPEGVGNVRPASQIASEERAKLKEQIEKHIRAIELKFKCRTGEAEAIYYEAKATALLALATLVTKGE